MREKFEKYSGWIDWAASAMSFLASMLILRCDYDAGAFTGKGVVTGLYPLRQCIPYVTLLVALLLRPIIEKSERNARLLPQGYLCVQVIFAAISTFSVSRAAMWVFRPAHSYLFFAHISNLEVFYTALSFLMLVWGCVVIPYGKRIHSNMICWVVSGAYLVSLVIEVWLQISSGQVYLSVVFWLSSQMFYYLSFNSLADLMTPENKMKLRREK